MPFAAADHAAQPIERSRGVAAVDRVGELPRRHPARLAQEGLDLVLAELALRARRSPRGRRAAQGAGRGPHRADRRRGHARTASSFTAAVSNCSLSHSRAARPGSVSVISPFCFFTASTSARCTVPPATSTSSVVSSGSAT